MLKNILAVIAGYVVFAVTSLLFFKLTKQPPHAEASLIFKIATLAYGIVISILAGFVVQLIARRNHLKVNIALALLMFVLALTSMLMTTADAHWTQWFTMLFFAPVSVLGGYLKQQRLG